MPAGAGFSQKEDEYNVDKAALDLEKESWIRRKQCDAAKLYIEQLRQQN